MKMVNRENVNLELLFLASLICFSLWIFYGSLSFSDRGRLFPLYTSLIVIIISFVLIAKEFYPENRIIQILAPDTGVTEEDVLGEDIDEVELEEEESENKRTQAHMSILFGLYLLACLVLGFLLSSFLFTLSVQTYYRYGSLKFRVFFSSVITLIVFGAYRLLRIPLDQGMIFG